MSGDNKSKRPANTAFKQQRLKAWQPILTPKTVLPAFFIVGIIFAPIGGILFYESGNISELTIDYTDCNKTDSTYQSVPDGKFSYAFPSTSKMSIIAPQYKLDKTTVDGQNVSQCSLQFKIPIEMKPPVFLYYQLTKFYQNHRKYVKSYDIPQLKGTQASTAEQLSKGGCSDMYKDDDTGRIYYPCGLIANSMFDDKIYSNLTRMSDTGDKAIENLTFSETGIAWSTDKQKYGPCPYTNFSQIVPPKRWQRRYPNGYTSDNIPKLNEDEHFQVWMRTAGLPNFRKLYGRIDNSSLAEGTYVLRIDQHFSTEDYGGTKSIVITTVSFLGGKNPFLGIAYIVVSVICVLLGCGFTLRHLYRPRKLGDHTYLSWNQQGSPSSPDPQANTDH